MAFSFSQFSSWKQKGLSTLSIVMVLSSVLIIMSIDLALRNIEREQSRLHQGKLMEVTNTVEACMEEALLKLNGNHSYTGESFYFNDVFCIIEVTEDSADIFTIRVFAHTEDIYAKEIMAQVDVSSTLEILSWQAD